MGETLQLLLDHSDEEEKNDRTEKGHRKRTGRILQLGQYAGNF